MSFPPRVDDGPTRLVLGIAMALSAALLLYEGRDTTFFNDEWVLFQRFAGDFDWEILLTPFNGHLIGTGSLIFDIGLDVFGPEPMVFRLIGVASLLLLAAVLYGYLRRLVSPWLALAPVVVILFMGASWEVLMWPMTSISTCLGAAAGVGALMMLERPSRRRDAAACLLLALGLATGTYALAFFVGAIVLVLGRADRWGRAWIFILPLTLFAAWWLWARGFGEGSSLDLVNIWLFPSFALNSLGVVLAAFTGLTASLSGEGINPTIEIDASWGPVLAVVALVGLGFRVARGKLPLAFWATLAALLTFWALITLSFGPDRTPEQSRYILPVAILLLLVAGQALAGVRIPRPAAVAVALVTLVAIATGIRQIHDAGVFFRDYSDRARATLAGLEAAPTSDPAYAPADDASLTDVVPRQLPITTGGYLIATERQGSPAFSREELREQPEAIQEIADRVRVAAIAADAGVEPPDSP